MRLWPQRGPRGRDQKRTKARVRRPRSWRRAVLGWGGLIAVLAAAVVFLFFWSAAFVVEDVKVTGVKGEVADSVVHHADIPHGRPLARVSESRVSERVLAGDTRVRSVTVERQWPSTVVYDVQLREPALALRQGSTTWLADAGGLVYDTARKTPKGVPTVRVSEAPEELSRETVQGLVELWATRPAKKELEGKLSTPRYAANGTVSLKIDQLTVEWGVPAESEKKWKVVSALLGQDSIDPQGGIPQTIDVSTPETPVVTGIPPAPQG
jgi:cell division protein FtsQ